MTIPGLRAPCYTQGMRKVLLILLLTVSVPGLEAHVHTGVLAGGSWALSTGPASSLNGAGRITLFIDNHESHWPASLGLAIGYSPYTLSGATGYSYRLTSLALRSWWTTPLGLPEWLALEAGVMAGAGFERLGNDSRGGYSRAFLLGSGLRTRFDLGPVQTGLELDWEWVIEPETAASFLTAGLFVALRL